MRARGRAAGALATCAVALAAAICAPPAARAQAPSARWRVVETPHFRIHFPAGDPADPDAVDATAWSRRLGMRLESVRERVGAEVGHLPETRIDVVVADPAAVANGSAWPLLGSPRMVLWTTPPGAASTLARRGDWGELVAVHEVAHLAHLLRPSRNPWRALAGRTLVPLGPLATKAPRWAIEGYATLVEGRVTGSGRPGSAFRAALLRAWGRRGRLPSFERLSSDRDAFLGGSMAYLVGSAFLDWAERRADDPDALRKLWAAASARADRSFDEAWRRVFAVSPRESYARFAAENAAAGLAAERAIAPLAREGEVWLALAGATGEPAVSPRGDELAAIVREPRRRPRLVVWPLGAPSEAADAAAVDPALDPEDPPAAPAAVGARPVARTLEPAGAIEPAGARWLLDGSGLLVVALAPDRDGFRRSDLFLWRDGELGRVTRGADLFDADPLPDGRTAIAVRWRGGASALVRVRLADGAVEPIDGGGGGPSLETVHDQPRVAPDGSALAWLEHREGRWHALVAPLGPLGELGAPRELAADGEPSHLAWHPRGSHLYLAVARGERIDLEAVALAPDAASHQVTRSLDAAFAPAPAPDGATLFYLALAPDGLEIRRLPLDAATVQLAGEPEGPTLAPAAARPPELAIRPESVGAERPYGLGRADFQPLVAGWWRDGEGDALELALAAGDLVGRWRAVAIGALGGEEARRGAALRAELERWPIGLDLHLARIDEAAARSDAAELVGGRRLTGVAGTAELAAGLAWSRFEPLEAASDAAAEARERSAGFVALAWSGRFARGALAARPSIAVERVEALDGASAWSAFAAGLELAREERALGLWARRHEAASPESERDRIRLGGAPSSLAPARHEPGRIDHPALAAGELEGRRLDGYGARLRASGPVALFWERWESDGASEPIELAGVEIAGRFGPEPLLGLPRLGWRVGVARGGGALAGASDGSTRWWLGLTLPGAATAAR